jgi:SAM-dependent methyltransferase
MADAAAVSAAQTAYWNSPANARWVTEQARIDALFAPPTMTALDIAAPQPGESVLDIGCGTGFTTLQHAARVGPGGQVLGVDISAQMLELAGRRIAGAGLPQARVALADAATYSFAPAAADLLFSRFGVMFFGDPVAAFANLRAALKPSGRVLLMVFRPGPENPWSTGAIGAIRHLVDLPPPAGPEDPGQFAFADPARVRRILGGAGFREVALAPFDFTAVLGPDAAAAADMSMQIGGAARLLQGLPAATLRAARVAMEAYFRPHEGPAGIALPGALWLVSARP